MFAYKVIFVVIFIVHLIPLLNIVGQLTAEFVQAKVDTDAGGIERGTRTKVDLGGCSKAEGSGLILTNIDQSVEQETESVRAAEATVEQLQQDANAANTVVEEVTASLDSTQHNADSAKVAALVAQFQLRKIKEIADELSRKLANKKKEAKAAQAQLDEHRQLLEAARMRVANATRRMADAQADFDKTKEDVMKAVNHSKMQQSYGGVKINKTHNSL